MEPSTKRRKLAPKVNTSTDPNPTQPQPQSQPPAQPPNDAAHYPASDPPLAERHEFESFARHLQDAAMFIQRQAERPQYTDVSVLILKWDGDEFPEEDISALDQLLQSTYHYRTQRWQIPSCPNPSIKLGVQIASFLENPKPDQLLIIYYAGYGFVGNDGQLYWASGCEDSSKLKWDGVRCLLEDAQSDMLLLLDTCAIPEPPPSGNNGLKQAIAATAPGYDQREGSSKRSFTSFLVEALRNLNSANRPFKAHRLHEEIQLLQHHSRQPHPSTTTNGGTSGPAPPIFFTITPSKGQHLSLAPVQRCRSASGTSDSNGFMPDQEPNNTRDSQLIDADDVADIKFEEPRILVCTTFVGDASPDMSFFNQWLQNTPSMGAKIAVEGMFIGPPTMLLISMPHSVWNVVQHDKVCCFLGYITSHNILHLYERLLPPSASKVAAKRIEEGHMAIEPTKTVKRPHSFINQEQDPRDASHLTAAAQEGLPISDRVGYLPGATPTRTSYVPVNPGSAPVKAKEENEGSAEMREAAEQLKALSHTRHRSDEGPQTTSRPRTSLPNGILHTDSSGHEQDGDSPVSPTKPRSPNRVKVPRHAFPKNETRCSHCTHAPFRDSSSLRKHIAAAHTRPFPCAFSFAGCNSTFGSKNEWKRHIASQHLCLQFYRCSECPRSAVEGKANEFNRKDLFTQHLRRMHAPFQIKRPISTRDSRMQAEWELQVKSLQESCLITRRHPPQKSACPKPGCQSSFEGPSAWDEWTEHVGRHMEKGEANDLGIDQCLIVWALEEDVIEKKADGEFRLCHNHHGNSNASNISNSNSSSAGSGGGTVGGGNGVRGVTTIDAKDRATKPSAAPQELDESSKKRETLSIEVRMDLDE